MKGKLTKLATTSTKSRSPLASSTDQSDRTDKKMVANATKTVAMYSVDMHAASCNLQ